jgi:N-terminal domain of anti-restriction factor ArdC
MATRRAERVRNAPERVSLYGEITDKIIAELEEGCVPWVQPWGNAAGTAAVGLPRNAATNRAYSGVNILILWGAVIGRGYPAQTWLTFNQARALGGAVRRGERGTTVVYAGRFTPDDERERAARDGEEPGAIPFLKRYTVFNVAQCEGLPPDFAAQAPPPPADLILPRADALIRATGAAVTIGGRLSLLRRRAGPHPGPAAPGLLRADRLAPHGVPRTRPLDGRRAAARARPHRPHGLQELRPRGVGGRDDGRLRLRGARRCAPPIPTGAGPRWPSVGSAHGFRAADTPIAVQRPPHERSRRAHDRGRHDDPLAATALPPQAGHVRRSSPVRGSRASPPTAVSRSVRPPWPGVASTSR